MSATRSGIARSELERLGDRELEQLLRGLERQLRDGPGVGDLDGYAHALDLYLAADAESSRRFSRWAAAVKRRQPATLAYA